MKSNAVRSTGVPKHPVLFLFHISVSPLLSLCVRERVQAGMVISPRVSLHAYAYPWGWVCAYTYACVHVCVRARGCVRGYWVCVCVRGVRGWESERKATEQSAEPRSIVSTRLERLNRSTSLLLYALCAPRTRAPNERTPTVPHRTPNPFLSVSFSFSSGFHTVPSTFLSSPSFSLFLSCGAKPSTNLVTRTPGFKNARLSAPYARASLVFLFPWLRFSSALDPSPSHPHPRNSFEEFSRLASLYT